MPLFALGALEPHLPEDASVWIAPGAQVIADVRLSSGVSIWFNAVLRGDNEPIHIGRDSNVQDGAIFHTDPGYPLVIGSGVTVGHNAILHGCSVDDGSLIGMGAVILNGAKIGRNCLIGANALVTEGKEIPDGSMVVGQPGRIVKTLDEAAARDLRRAAEAYRARLDVYRDELRPIG